MALQAETFSGIHHQSFDLVVRFVGKHDIISPRPVFFPTGLNDDAFIDVEQRVDHVEQGSGLQHAISACFAVEADDLFESRHRGFIFTEPAFDKHLAKNRILREFMQTVRVRHCRMLRAYQR